MSDEESIQEEIKQFVNYYKDELKELDENLAYRFDDCDLEELKNMREMAKAMKEFIEEIYKEVNEK